MALSLFDLLLLMLVGVASFTCNLALIRFALRLGLVATSNERSSHSVTTPSAGGLAIAVSFSLAMIIKVIFGAPIANEFLFVWAGASILAGMGLIDDLKGLGVASRLLLQLIVVTCVVALLGARPMNIITILLIVLALGWWLNLFNFMDGIDGLAASETFFICIALILFVIIKEPVLINFEVYQSFFFVLLLLLFATIGFLIVNWSPARIFMGDCGSLFLGFTLASISYFAVTNNLFSPYLFFVLGAVFWVDASITLLRRIFCKEPFMDAHRSHSYQLAAIYYENIANSSESDPGKARARAHRKVCLWIFLINCCWLFPLAWLTQMLPEYAIIITLISWLPLLSLNIFFFKLTMIRK